MSAWITAIRSLKDRSRITQVHQQAAAIAQEDVRVSARNKARYRSGQGEAVRKERFLREYGQLPTFAPDSCTLAQLGWSQVARFEVTACEYKVYQNPVLLFGKNGRQQLVLLQGTPQDQFRTWVWVGSYLGCEQFVKALPGIVVPLKRRSFAGRSACFHNGQTRSHSLASCSVLNFRIVSEQPGRRRSAGPIESFMHLSSWGSRPYDISPTESIVSEWYCQVQMTSISRCVMSVREPQLRDRSMVDASPFSEPKLALKAKRHSGS